MMDLAEIKEVHERHESRKSREQVDYALANAIGMIEELQGRLDEMQAYVNLASRFVQIIPADPQPQETP